MSYSNQTPLHQLDSVISETVSHIHDFTKSPTDFTRNRKLNAETTIKTILNMQGNSLITNLNRFEFPIEKMKELYHLRWDIETSFRELKYALGGISFHSKKDDFIQMEILAYLIMFNAVSRSISKVNVPKRNPKYDYAIDFKMACLIIRKYFNKYCGTP